MLIGIIGRKRCGKDTMAEHLIRKGFRQETFAGPLKEVCRIMFGFNDEQLYGDRKEEEDDYWKITPRHAFQYLGTDLVRMQFGKLLPQVGDQFWLKCLERRVLNLRREYGDDTNIVVSDIRFQNELDLIHELGGTVVRVKRPATEVDDAHVSEAMIDSIVGEDHQILNTTTIEEYYRRVDDWFKEVAE